MWTLIRSTQGQGVLTLLSLLILFTKIQIRSNSWKTAGKTCQAGSWQRLYGSHNWLPTSPSFRSHWKTRAVLRRPIMPWLHAPISSTEVLMGLFWLTGKKTSPEKIGKNEHAHSVRFSRTTFLNRGQHLGRGKLHAPISSSETNEFDRPVCVSWATDLGARVVIKKTGDELGAVLGILIVAGVHTAYLRHYNNDHELECLQRPHAIRRSLCYSNISHIVFSLYT